MDVDLEGGGGGLGEAGMVQLVPSLWNRYVRPDLLGVYRRWDGKHASGIQSSNGVGVSKVRESICQRGRLKQSAACHGCSKARVIPKNSQKCSLIFAHVGLNVADSRKPAEFTLPHIECIVCHP